MSIVAFSVSSDNQKPSVSPSVANSTGCAVSANRGTASSRLPSTFLRHLGGADVGPPGKILGCVGGQRQWLATYSGGRTPVNASITSLRKEKSIIIIKIFFCKLL